MASYLVTWEIDIDADSPREAAEIALRTQRDVDSQATVFGVRDAFGNFGQFDLYGWDDGEGECDHAAGVCESCEAWT